MKNKILVIEDDRAISELLCMNLEAAGYETVAAYDGSSGRRLPGCSAETGAVAGTDFGMDGAGKEKTDSV